MVQASLGRWFLLIGNEGYACNYTNDGGRLYVFSYDVSYCCRDALNQKGVIISYANGGKFCGLYWGMAGNQLSLYVQGSSSATRTDSWNGIGGTWAWARCEFYSGNGTADGQIWFAGNNTYVSNFNRYADNGSYCNIGSWGMAYRGYIRMQGNNFNASGANTVLNKVGYVNAMPNGGWTGSADMWASNGNVVVTQDSWYTYTWS